MEKKSQPNNHLLDAYKTLVTSGIFTISTGSLDFRFHQQHHQMIQFDVYPSTSTEGVARLRLVVSRGNLKVKIYG